MTGSQPLTNCRCLAFVDFSATRNTTKLAGTKDMATMMKIAITTSVPWSLEIKERVEKIDLPKLTFTDCQTYTTQPQGKIMPFELCESC